METKPEYLNVQLYQSGETFFDVDYVLDSNGEEHIIWGDLIIDGDLVK